MLHIWIGHKSKWKVINMELCPLVDSLSIAVNAFVNCMSMSFSVDEILLPRKVILKNEMNRKVIIKTPQTQMTSNKY